MQELRLIDPDGYTVPGAVESNVPHANVDKVRDLLLNQAATSHAQTWGNDVRDYRVQPTRV